MLLECALDLGSEHLQKDTQLVLHLPCMFAIMPTDPTMLFKYSSTG